MGLAVVPWSLWNFKLLVGQPEASTWRRKSFPGPAGDIGGRWEKIYCQGMKRRVKGRSTADAIAF